MKSNVPYNGEGNFSHRSFRIPMNAGRPSALPASLRTSAAEGAPALHAVMPWGVFAAYAAALATTGFLFVMALTGGIHLG